MTINELRIKRAKAWEATKAFLDSHRNSDGVLSAEDDATYTRMEQEVTDLGKEIARLERQVNFELVQIESGSRPMALSSGKVDAVFWTKGVYCLECKELRTEDVQGTLVTESYFADAPAAIKLKSDK